MTTEVTPESEIWHHYAWLLRSDFPSFMAKVFSTVNPGTAFQPNWHIEAIAEYLEAARRGEIQRLIINMPPRALKSVCVSVAWPAFLLGHDPAARILGASYAAPLALKHSLDCRLVLQASWYRQLFPQTRLCQGQNEKHKFVTTARGYRYATSVGGVATGEGGNFLIVDDPLNPLQAASETWRDLTNQWFDQTFSTRLDDKARGVIIVVMQRLHERDLTGYLLEKGGWERLCLPAIAPERHVIHKGKFQHIREEGAILHAEREGSALLERAKRELGSAGFAAQYQQQPLPEGQGLIQRRWLQRYREAPPMLHRIIQSWDTAHKESAQHDPSVCATFGETEAGFYLLEVETMRLDYPGLKNAVRIKAQTWQPAAILIEDKASGQSLIQELRKETTLPVIPCQPRGDKYSRLSAVAPLIEAGKLLLPVHASWLADFESELLQFPHARHDDQVDALTQFLQWTRARKGNMLRIRVI